MTFCGDFFNQEFMPHGHCYQWQPEILWPHVIGDLVTAVCYFTIPLLLIQFVRKRKDVTFNYIFWAFAIFILSCGATHFIAVFSVWEPFYRSAALAKVITAIASLSTVILLIWKMPAFLSIPSQKQLKAKNDELNEEMQSRIEAQNQLIELNKDLEARIEKRTEKLSELNAELKLFTSMVTHDLKSPLETLSIVAKMLEEEDRGAFSESGKEAIEILITKPKELADLISKFMDLSSLRQNELLMNRVDLQPIIKTIIDNALTNLNGSIVKIEVDVMPEILADKGLITQVFQNLIQNAFKFSSKKELAEINIKYSLEDEFHKISIEDNGAGFDPEKENILFEPFKRLHTQKDFSGTGVGLAIVKRIIEKHGGKITAKSEVDKGAKFTILLPVRDLSEM